MRAHQADTGGRRNLGEFGFMTTPRIVEQIGTRSSGLAANLGSPGVDTDDERRVLFPYQRDEIGDPLDLLRGVDVRPWSGFDPTDVDDVRAVSDRAADGGQCRLGRERRALIEERIGGAIDDGHDGELVVAELALTQSQRHWLSRDLLCSHGVPAILRSARHGTIGGCPFCSGFWSLPESSSRSSPSLLAVAGR